MPGYEPIDQEQARLMTAGATHYLSRVVRPLALRRRGESTIDWEWPDPMEGARSQVLDSGDFAVGKRCPCMTSSCWSRTGTAALLKESRSSQPPKGSVILRWRSI